MYLKLTKKSKRLTTCLILLIIISTLGVPTTVYSAKKTQAVTIRIENIIGKGAFVSNIAGKKMTARKKMKLYSGYKVSTSRKNYVYMSLDSSKAIKQDQNSKIQVKKQGKKNEIFVLNGKIFFNVNKNLKSNESMNVKTSNMSMGIRGTSGVVSVEPKYDNSQRLTELVYFIQIFDGTGYIEYGKNDGTKPQETSLKAGYQLVIKSEVEGTGKTNVSIEKINADDIPAFAIEEILNNREVLNKVLDETKMKESELKEALKKNKEEEEKKEEDRNKVIEEIKNQISNVQTIIYEEEEKDSSSEGSSNESSSKPAPNEYSFNIDKLSGSKLKQEDLDKAFSNHSIIRLTTKEAQKILDLSGEITIREKNNLVIDDKITLNNSEDSILKINGKITNYGTKSIHNKGKIENAGVIENAGKFLNEAGSIFRNTGTIKNMGEIDNVGQMHFDGGKVVNSGIISNKKGAYFTEYQSVSYENTGSLRMFSGVELESEIKAPWEIWRVVRFLDYDSTTVLKDTYSKINELPEPPTEVMKDTEFTGWNVSYEGAEDMEVAATKGALMKLDYKGMIIACDSFNEINEKAGMDSPINITLMRNYNMSEVIDEENQIQFTNNDKICLNLNGYTISTTGYQTFRNEGYLTIKNNKDTGGINAVLRSEEVSTNTREIPFADSIFINDFAKDEGSFILENVNITVTSEQSSLNEYCVFNNLNEANILLRNCQFVLKGTGNPIGIKNYSGWIELQNTKLLVNTSNTTVIDLGEYSPEGALRASNSRLIGGTSANYIIGISVKSGHEDRIIGGESVMTFELGSTGQNISYY